MIYALHAFSLLSGILGAATVVGAFLTGWPSIIAVILNYVKRGEVRGTWLESHFRWQIRNLLVRCAVDWALHSVRHHDLRTRHSHRLAAGRPIVGLWFIYRVVRGWLALNARRPMYSVKRGA